MKIITMLLAMLAVLPCARAADESYRLLFEKGRDAFQRGDFETAAQAYDKAASLPADQGGDPARARLNQGVALYRQNKSAEAAETFSRASQTTDPALQTRSLYNAATTRARTGEELGASGKLPEAIRELESALPVFRDTLKLNPNDDDARSNYEVSLQRLEEFKKRQEEQKQDQQQDQKDQDQKDQDQQKQDQQQNQDQKQQDQKDQQQQDQKNQDQQKQDQQDQKQDQSTRQNDQDAQSEEEKQAARDRPAKEMTREEAAMLLDALMREEAARRERLRLKFGEPQPVDKDW